MSEKDPYATKRKNESMENGETNDAEMRKDEEEESGEEEE
jgi:hypothetical protein